MVLQYKLFQTQRAQETPTEQAQESPQRQALDINKEYLQSQYFFVKLAELVNYECLWKKSVQSYFTSLNISEEAQKEHVRMSAGFVFSFSPPPPPLSSCVCISQISSAFYCVHAGTRALNLENTEGP